MKNIFKKLLKIIVPGFVFNGLNARMRIKHAKALGRNITLIPAFRKESTEREYVNQFVKVLRKTDIKEDFYINPFDPNVLRQIPYQSQQIVSITPDFSRILDFKLTEYRNKLSNTRDTRFGQNMLKLLGALESYTNRIVSSIGGKERSLYLKKMFGHLLVDRPTTFDEALQKILFFDGLFWQMKHMHIGLGRLDMVLYDFYKNDIEKGIITKDDAEKMLHHFLYSLSRDTKAKSVSLIGDTGQYILLGGIDKDGNNVDNELTELFIDLFSKYDRPDPKLILRVNKNTKRQVWEKAVKSLSSGIGSPLIMNEEVVMESMEQFGYRDEDLYQLGTSACWEPLIIGKSFDQNNPLPNIVSLVPLNQLIKSHGNYDDFRSFLEDYKAQLDKHIHSSVKDINFDCSPLFTLFTEDCIEIEKDFTKGGARYNYHGIQIVSFPNTINALLNIKKYVFEDKCLSLEDCEKVIVDDFIGHEDVKMLFQANPLKYGSTEAEVLDLTNELITFVGKVSEHITINGQKVKVGFSSSQYIAQAQRFEASIDGRKKGDPFAVHISPISSNIDITEILDFASKLKYDGNKMNGNVVDFIIPEAYLNNQEKFVDLLMASCKKGVFQIQLNVLNRDMLVDAKAHPEKYPGLIVRVWGFSAYFNDIPEAYKDNLIQRASLYCA